MAEAQKMMNDPNFKKQMKQFEKSKEFKDAASRAKEMMEDPQTAARMQVQAEQMLKRGNDMMKQGAMNSMADAMEAMNDPAVMGQALKMMKDPNFVKQMQAMQNDPAFANYVQAVSGHCFGVDFISTLLRLVSKFFINICIFETSRRCNK